MVENVIFLPELGNKIYAKSKEAVQRVIWEDLGTLRLYWSLKTNIRMNALIFFTSRSNLDDEYLFTYDSSICVSRFDEHKAFRNIYNN